MAAIQSPSCHSRWASCTSSRRGPLPASALNGRHLNGEIASAKRIVTGGWHPYVARPMFNDLSSPLAYLPAAAPGRAREMVGPGPERAELAMILALAARTPDHGKLSPWRFVIVGPTSATSLPPLLARALDENDPTHGDAHRHKADEFARSRRSAGGAAVRAV
jgi:hypothetical protein